MSSSSSAAGQSRFGLTSEPMVWSFAMIIVLAILALAVLRHLFGSIKVDFAAGSK
jgi:hypothetical protein